MIELKPCPFCGSNCKISEIYYDNVSFSYGACCTQCGCSLVPRYSKEEAAEVWNKRSNDWIHIDDKLPEDYENILIFVNDLISEPVQADVCYYDGDEAWLDSGYNFGSDVTYWMPLPKPPEVNE